MRDFIISTDSTADLPADFIAQHNILVQPLFYDVNGTHYGGDQTLPYSDFYQAMREGAEVATSAINPERTLRSFCKAVEEGYDILHLSFSSALSSSYSNACIMAREVLEEHPTARIEVVDSLCASLGQGLFVYYVVKLKEQGHSIDEILDWIGENRLHICHQFTVDDLKYLYKGGRISKTVAILGTLINVKPVLHVDDNGKLVPMSNVRGRKKALNSLVDNMAAQLGRLSSKNDCVFIGHADCPEDAQYVADKVKERFGLEATIIDSISPTIGAHSGPGTVALFHLGESRMIGT